MTHREEAARSRAALSAARRIVVKLGTQVVVDAEGRPALSRLYGLMETVASLRRQGAEPVLVSSGAVGLGARQLGIRPGGLPQKQACAAAGQGQLMSIYQEGFARMGLCAAQVLLTEDDFTDLIRLFTLLQSKAVYGRRLGAVSNAGYECVAIADNIGNLELPDFTQATSAHLLSMFERARIDAIVDRVGLPRAKELWALSEAGEKSDATRMLRRVTSAVASSGFIVRCQQRLDNSIPARRDSSTAASARNPEQLLRHPSNQRWVQVFSGQTRNLGSPGECLFHFPGWSNGTCPTTPQSNGTSLRLKSPWTGLGPCVTA